MQCPVCNGKKFILAFVNQGDLGPHHYGRTPCYFCRETGVVDDGYPARAEAGKKMRLDRLARGETLKEASDKMGISPADLSSIESGRLLRDPYTRGRQ